MYVYTRAFSLLLSFISQRWKIPLFTISSIHATEKKKNTLSHCFDTKRYNLNEKKKNLDNISILSLSLCVTGFFGRNMVRYYNEKLVCVIFLIPFSIYQTAARGSTCAREPFTRQQRRLVVYFFFFTWFEIEKKKK